jgi:hypothetical protein
MDDEGRSEEMIRGTLNNHHGVLPVNVLIRATAAILLAVSAAPAHAAEPPKEIADLFPAGTLAYAELHNTAELAPQLAAVFKGTVLEDSVPFIHGRKDAAKTMMDLTNKQSVAILGLLASPEMLAEFKRLRIAAGVTGFAANGDPEAAVVILTHDSPAAGLAARAFLTMTTQLRKVGDVAKVPIFQYRNPNFNYDPNGNQVIQNDKAFTDGPHEPTFAYLPGLFVMGTSKTSVGHAIKRFVGEEKGGLAGTAAFKEAAAAHRQTGLFFFVNYPEFSARLGAARRAGDMPRGASNDLRSLFFGGESNLTEMFNLTANPKAVKSLAGSVRFRDGGLVATVTAKFDPAHKSPLLDVLSGPGVKLELLHHAPHPSTYAIALTLPEKKEAVIGFLDAVAKSKGEIGRLPRDIVREITEKHKIDVAQALIGKVRAATVIMPGKQELPKGGKPGPMLVLHTTDAAAAAAWETFVPKLLGELAGAASPPQSSSETINGVKVLTVSGAGLRWNAPVHFARDRAIVVIGLDRKLVAAAVVANPATSVVGGDKSVSPPGGEPAALFGVISLGEVIPSLFERTPGSGEVVPVEGPLVLPNGQPIPESTLEELKKARKELAAALATLSPATVTARRTGNELRIEVYQPKVQQGALKTAIDAAANWLDRSVGLGGDIRTFSGRGGLRRR